MPCTRWLGFGAWAAHAARAPAKPRAPSPPPPSRLPHDTRPGTLRQAGWPGARPHRSPRVILLPLARAPTRAPHTPPTSPAMARAPLLLLLATAAAAGCWGGVAAAAAARPPLLSVRLRRLPLTDLHRAHHANKSQLLTFTPRLPGGGEGEGEEADVPITNFMDAQASCLCLALFRGRGGWVGGWVVCVCVCVGGGGWTSGWAGACVVGEGEGCVGLAARPPARLPTRAPTPLAHPHSTTARLGWARRPSPFKLSLTLGQATCGSHHPSALSSPSPATSMRATMPSARPLTRWVREWEWMGVGVGVGGGGSVCGGGVESDWVGGCTAHPTRAHTNSPEPTHPPAHHRRMGVTLQSSTALDPSLATCQRCVIPCGAARLRSAPPARPAAPRRDHTSSPLPPHSLSTPPPLPTTR